MNTQKKNLAKNSRKFNFSIDFLALKIKDIAKENNVTIIENPALARALYDQIEVDKEIPNQFYKAIAEIFSYLYELKRKR